MKSSRRGQEITAGFLDRSGTKPLQQLPARRMKLWTGNGTEQMKIYRDFDLRPGGIFSRQRCRTIYGNLWTPHRLSDIFTDRCKFGIDFA
ncbi:hypothetical protein GWI33_017373 [Rhynchophorus ferrugineus]|uniref:Uncharacterized protein n=1 Tax=Rhynchophorus ferrugineus TaxID=354439 RepID=A0A834M690_RHYFE|nr:hypothetical protein GWI33_017373 [Rhynchophorus ferrugineus]